MKKMYFIGKYLNEAGKEYARVYAHTLSQEQASEIQLNEIRTQGDFFRKEKITPELPPEETDVWNQVCILEQHPPVY